METQETSSLLNQTVGERYLVVSLLGSGAMGHVYLAEDSQLGRKVAIKVLRDEWGNQADVIKRLENECKLMAHLGNHPNIVSLIDRLVVDGKTMLVMEYAEGEPLSHILARTALVNGVESEYKVSTTTKSDKSATLLTPPIIQRIATQCLKALDYAHSRGVLHLDIKPGNIMVQKDQRGQVKVKLMDFGIGQTRRDINLVSAVTALTFTSEGGIGTPAYMAPEQIDPERFGKVGPATDLYSFAVMLFEMLTLRLPFTGAYTEVLNAHANTTPPDPRNYNPNIPPPIARIVLTALRKSPGNRYSSAGEMLLDLQGLLDSTARQNGMQEYVAAETSGNLSTLKRYISTHLKPLLFLGLLTIFPVLLWWSGFASTIFNSFGTHDGMTRIEARNSVLGVKAKAEIVLGDSIRGEEFIKADSLFDKAEKQSEGKEAVRLFLEAKDAYSDIIREKEKEGKGEGEVTLPPVQEGEILQDESAFSEPKPIIPFESKTDIIDIGNGVAIDMAWIPPGVFVMGEESYSKKKTSKTIEELPDNIPSREVWIPRGFWMGVFEITQEQWGAVMQNNPSRFKGRERLPVDSINWNDCQNFITRLNSLVENGGFRLPTEAEWEYAARAGTNTPFFFGANKEKLADYSWFSINSAGASQPVGLKLPNPWGLYDTSGNLFEWVQDWYDPDYYKTAPYAYPLGPTTGLYKVLRGGSWSYLHDHCINSARSFSLPDAALDIYGFRIARDDMNSTAPQ